MMNCLKKKTVYVEGWRNKKHKRQKYTYEDMTKIPIDEIDLVEDPIFWTMKKQISVHDYMSSKDIHTPVLKLIFQNRFEEAEDMIVELSIDKVWDKDFQYELLMAFWLSVHFEAAQLTTRIMSFDLYLRQLVCLALHHKPEKPKNFRKSKVEKSKVVGAKKSFSVPDQKEGGSDED